MKWEKTEELEGGRAAVWKVTVRAIDGVEKSTNRILAFAESEENGALSGRVRVEFGSLGESQRNRAPSYS